MATFNLQNNAVNAFFPKRRRREVNFLHFTMAMLKLHSGVKRDVAKSCKIWFVSIFDGWVL
jgi:hypothetical protein